MTTFKTRQPLEFATPRMQWVADVALPQASLPAGLKLKYQSAVDVTRGTGSGDGFRGHEPMGALAPAPGASYTQESSCMRHYPPTNHWENNTNIDTVAVGWFE